MLIKAITGHEQARVIEWYDRAFNEPQVMRFLTIGHLREIPTTVDPDWTTLFLMDEGNHGLVKIMPARNHSSRYADMCCWVLPSAGEAKQRIAGSLLRRAIIEAVSRFDCKFIEWSVHSTNKESLAFSRKRATQFAFKEESAWDTHLAQWVGCHSFSLNAREFYDKRNANCK